MKKKDSNLFSFLIANEDFRDWVLHPNEQKRLFWEKWMDNHPEAISDVLKAKEFIERMSFRKEQLSNQESDEMLNNILANEKAPLQPGLYVQPRIKSKKKTLYTNSIWKKVAAILIACFASSALIYGFLSSGQQEEIATEVAVEWRTVENPKGRKSKFILPDGTLVMLNSASEIKYPLYFSGPERIVELKGEAFFEVVRDERKPFKIHTERMTTEVLGTSFGINAYPDGENHHVAVVSGKVKVSNKSGVAEILHPEEMGVISTDNIINKTSFDPRQVVGWKDGIISFKRATFKDIEKQLSMWYGVNFIVDKEFKMDSVYTGEYANETLDNVMKGIAYSSGFKYKISEKKVLIFK